LHGLLPIGPDIENGVRAGFARADDVAASVGLGVCGGGVRSKVYSVRSAVAGWWFVDKLERKKRLCTYLASGFVFDGVRNAQTSYVVQIALQVWRGVGVTKRIECVFSRRI